MALIDPVVAIAGHVFGLWTIPRVSVSSDSSPISATLFDPRSIGVSYSRLNTDGVSPWPNDATDTIITRFVERWAEATLGRSHIRVLDETAVRGALVVFSNKRVVPDAEAHQMTFAAGRFHYIELFAPVAVLGVDVEYTAGTLLHEMGHALGCCSGPGTLGGHYFGTTCTRILCSPHGNAKTFSEDELRQMGLGG